MAKEDGTVLTVFEIDSTCEEIKQLLVESEFHSRWVLIEGYHKIGKLISDLHMQGENPMGKDALLQALAGKIGKGERTLYYALKFYETYPDLNALPEGKNASWNQVIMKHLTTSKKAKDICEHPNDKKFQVEITICGDCDKQLEKRTILAKQ